MTPISRMTQRPAVRGVLVMLLASAVSGQAPVDRTQPPRPGPPPSLRLPEVEKHRLANGLPVLLVEQHEVPVVVVNLLVKSGASSDPLAPRRLAGLAQLTVTLLTHGAGGRNALEIADAVDYLGATLAAGAGWDSSSVRLFTPVARLQPALEIFADVALRPTFPSEELNRVRKEVLTEFLQEREEPRALASAASLRGLYRGVHRYGVDVDGDAPSVRAITRSDVEAFHRMHYSPENASCLVVGDVTAASVLPFLERALGGFKGAAPPAAGQADAPQVKRREILLVDKPGAAQSELRFTRIGAARATPDYFVLEVLNTILGGSFTSRLNDNLRERHGYSYGAGSSFALRRGKGPFVAAAAVHTEVTDKAVAEVVKELTRIREPVSAEELERARNYLLLGYPAEFETTSQIAAKLAELVLYDLPGDFFNKYAERIRAVTVEDVQRVARAYIDPERILIVVVGDRKAIEPGLRKLGLGPPRVLSVDEILGKRETGS